MRGPYFRNSIRRSYWINLYCGLITLLTVSGVVVDKVVRLFDARVWLPLSVMAIAAWSWRSKLLEHVNNLVSILNEAWNWDNSFVESNLNSFLSWIQTPFGLQRKFVERDDLGCVRLSLFRNKNTWSDDLKRCVWRLICSNKNKKAMFKIAFKQIFNNINVNPRKKQRISNFYSMYSYSGIRSIERALNFVKFA